MTLSEILSFADQNEDPISILHQQDCEALRVFLKLTFDKNLAFLLPRGAPPYFEADHPDKREALCQQIARLLFFVDDTIPQRQREHMFVELLESIDKDDAKLLLFCKDNRSLPYPSLTLELVAEAFPGLLPA